MPEGEAKTSALVLFNNIIVMIRAEKGNIQACKGVFASFQVVSDLKVNWKDISAVYFPFIQRPAELDSSDWKWEKRGNIPKSFDFTLKQKCHKR
jgi:hypothetical protein